MTLKELEALRQIALSNEAKTQGAIERDMAQLKLKFNVNTLEEAEALLYEMEEGLQHDEPKLRQLLVEVEKWKGKL